MLTIGFGGLLLTNALISDLKKDLLEINKAAKKEKQVRKCKTRKNRVHKQNANEMNDIPTVKKLCGSIQMHSELKQFSEYEIVKTTLLYQNFSC